MLLRRTLLVALAALAIAMLAPAGAGAKVVWLCKPGMGNVNTLLGGEGTTFEQAVDSFPLCCPSRTTNLTGQYAHNHGVLHNSPPFGGYLELDGTSTLPVWLQNAGYRTMPRKKPWTSTPNGTWPPNALKLAHRIPMFAAQNPKAPPSASRPRCGWRT